MVTSNEIFSMLEKHPLQFESTGSCVLASSKSCSTYINKTPKRTSYEKKYFTLRTADRSMNSIKIPLTNVARVGGPPLVSSAGMPPSWDAPDLLTERIKLFLLHISMPPATT